MELVLMRIDDRFIHGQITTTWMSWSGAEIIWVVNDKIASNLFVKKMQEGLAPAKVYGVEEAIKQWDEDKDRNTKVFILTAGPKDSLALIKNGIKLDWLSVGGMGYRNGRVQVSQQTSVTKEEAKLFKEIYDMGIKLIERITPVSDRPEDFMELLKKHPELFK